MKLFDSLRRKKLNILIDNEFTSEGVEISIYKKGELVDIPISFTISELKQLDKFAELQLLEELVANEALFSMKLGKYLLSYDQVYTMDPEERRLLGLPAEPTPVKIKLDNEKFVGTSGFKFITEVSSDEYKNLHIIGERKGAVIELSSSKEILLEEDYFRFLELIDQQPKTADSDDLLSFVAEVKKEAISLGIELSDYIQNENYEFIDEIDVQLQRDENGIEILPQYKHEEVDDNTLQELVDDNKHYMKEANKRIFVKKEVTNAKENIQQLPSIKNEEIPNFVQNPSAFYTEDLGISLEDFSDRVKELNIRVYKAQPYIHADENDRGWFEYEAGYKIKDAEGNEVSAEGVSYFEGENGSFKQLSEDSFIELPDQVKEFQDLSQKITQQPNEPEEFPVGLSNYVLEIFENFSHIEYNRPLEIKREELQKERIFESHPPEGFKATLKPFQVEGFKWMKTLRPAGLGGLLADDMGLGKTIQVIAYLLHLKEQGKLTPTLIVLPKTLIENWINESQKFAPDLTRNIYIHRGPDRLKDDKQIASYDIVITTYHTLARDQLILGKVDWEMVICDEAQHIKNPTTANSVAIKALKNKGRLALTGTPVENNLTELWSIVDFVQPGLLGSLKEFRAEYEDRIKEEEAHEEVQSALEKRMSLIYLRRTKSDELQGQLPDKYEMKIPVSIGREQARYYGEMIKAVQADSISGLQAIQRLKMVCSHPGLVDETLKDVNINKVPKLKHTVDLIKQVKEKNEKVIIFTEYRKMQGILKKEILKAFDLNAGIINGESGHRQATVDTFNLKEGFDVLILSPKSAGTGLTITGANHVIHYTRWWNPAVENQATDRVYRIGQEKDVHVYYPIVGKDANNRTVENIIDEILEEKKALAENVIVPSKGQSIEQEVLKKMKIA
jgi:SNF2 family DNA or RNA helicase